MSLPYENATSGKTAVNDMQKILRGFGAASLLPSGETVLERVERSEMLPSGSVIALPGKGR